MSKLDEIKQAYEAQKAKQSSFQENPHTPGAKKNARMAGVIFLIFGLGFVGINYYTWTELDVAYNLLLAAAVGFLFLGIFMTITGRAPKPKLKR